MFNIIIVDDNTELRQGLEDHLSQKGFRVSALEDGERISDAINANKPDAILLDWNMPVMNGIDFLRHLRADPGGDRPVVVFCTTENDITAIAQAIESGANEYIMKPFDSEIVQSKFAEVGLVSPV